jgi:hypothetical protein
VFPALLGRARTGRPAHPDPGRPLARVRRGLRRGGPELGHEGDLGRDGQDQYGARGLRAEPGGVTPKSVGHPYRRLLRLRIARGVEIRKRRDGTAYRLTLDAGSQKLLAEDRELIRLHRWVRFSTAFPSYTEAEYLALPFRKAELMIELAEVERLAQAAERA